MEATSAGQSIAWNPPCRRLDALVSQECVCRFAGEKRFTVRAGNSIGRTLQSIRRKARLLGVTENRQTVLRGDLRRARAER
jgi:hypothetical protein